MYNFDSSEFEKVVIRAFVYYYFRFGEEEFKERCNEYLRLFQYSDNDPTSIFDDDHLLVSSETGRLQFRL